MLKVGIYAISKISAVAALLFIKLSTTNRVDGLSIFYERKSVHIVHYYAALGAATNDLGSR